MHFLLCFTVNEKETLEAKRTELDKRFGHPDDKPTIKHHMDGIGHILSYKLWLADNVWQHPPYAYVDAEGNWHQKDKESDQEWSKVWMDASMELNKAGGWDTIYIYADCHV